MVNFTASKLSEFAVLLLALAGLFAAAALAPACWRSFQANHGVYMDKCDADAAKWRASIERMQCMDRLGEPNARLLPREQELCEEHQHALATYDAYWCGMGRLVRSLGVVKWLTGVAQWAGDNWATAAMLSVVLCLLLGFI